MAEYSTSFSFDSVIIIESLPEGDLRSGRELFETIMQPAHYEHPSLLAELRTAGSRREFIDQLNDIAATVETHSSSPILQIETHGSREGLSLANGDTVSWSELAPKLVRINELTRFNLLVVAAACHGWWMVDILRPTERGPAFGIIGSKDLVSAGRLLESAQSFYRALFKRPHNLRQALIDANRANDPSEWQFEMMGAEIMLCRAYNAYLASLSTEESQEARVNRLVADIARVRNLDIQATMVLRTSIKEDLENHGRWYDHYRRKFLMLDSFPENDARFQLSYTRCREILD